MARFLSRTFGLVGALAAASGCALTGESAARGRYRDLVETSTQASPAPEVAKPSPATDEELDIQRKPLLGLQDCMRLAVLRSERLHASAERVHQADVAQIGAVSALLPTAAYNFAYFQQDPKVDSPFTPNETRTHRFVLSQPIFRGFSDWFNVAATGDLVERNEALLRSQKLDVALDCGRAFYAVVGIERTVETLEHSLKLENQRLEEVKAREQSGLARKTERLFIETDRARTEGDLARARHDLKAARALLAYHTGMEGAALDASDRTPARPEPVEKFLATAKDRPDIAALAREVEYQRHEVWASRGAFLPTMDATSNLYAHREGFFEKVGWDVTLGLNWNFFEGGRDIANMRIAESHAREAERNYADGRKRAETEIVAAYEAFLASLDRIPALETRVRSAEENVKLLDAEYKAGIASNLEAVDAENTRREAHLDLERELYNARRLELELRAASGDESLAPGAYPASPSDNK